MHAENALRIDTDVQTVWDVTIDVERWPDWCSNFQAVRRLDDGPFRLGSRAAIRQPGMPETIWAVIDFADGERFTWETRVRGLHLLATHVLTPDGGATRSVLRVEMRGLLARLLWPFLRGSVRRALERENAALAVACGGGSAARGSLAP